MKKVEKNNFRFNEFLSATIAFLKEYNCPETHPSAWIVWLDKDSPKVQWGPLEGRDNFEQQLNEGKSLFFRFSTECIDEEIQCVDGNTCACEDPQSDDFNGVLDGNDFLGYLVKLENDEYQIDLAIHSSEKFPYPEQIILDKVGEYETAMEEYLSKFIIS